MKFLKIFTLFVFIFSQKIHAQNTDDNWIINGLKTSEYQLTAAAQLFNDSMKCPRSIDENGNVILVKPKDWTSGFFPGSLWLMYELSGKENLKKEAQKYTVLLSNIQYYKDSHDVGFILYCSYGNGFRLTGDTSYKRILINGARSLYSRFNKKIGCIKSWDKRKEWQFPVIIDNMMNLELLMWANKTSGNASFKTAAISHADNTLKNHYRLDHSCYHVVDYDTLTGMPRQKQTFQGYNDSSSWARGQAWGLYGYMMMFRETKNKIYLDQAKKIADYLLNHPNLPEDKIPYWDFNAPDIPDAPRDASAAAIMASALIELSSYLDNGEKYFTLAETILKNLSSDKYLAAKGENGLFIIKHCVGNKPKNSEVDVPLSYGDYYYLEALERYCKAKNIDAKELLK